MNSKDLSLTTKNMKIKEPKKALYFFLIFFQKRLDKKELNCYNDYRKRKEKEKEK